MDGDALVTLVGLTPGPDSFKELVSKVGLWIKVYKVIKTLYNKESASVSENKKYKTKYRVESFGTYDS